MRKLPSLFILLAFSCQILCSQELTVEDNFEGNGTLESWYGDECGMDNGFANPYVQGINTSVTVLKYTDWGAQYANVRFDAIQNFDMPSHHTFSLKIYVPSSSITGSQPNQISLKLQDGLLEKPWETQSEIIKPVVLDQWQSFTFDFATDPYANFDPNSGPPSTRMDFNRVLIQVNSENNNDQVVAYIDDVFYDGTVGIDLPSTIYTKLVWSDEFNGNGAIDQTKWHHQTRLPNGVSWYNNEIQHYTNRQVNSFQQGGKLHIVARKETFTDQGRTKGYTSARLNSKFAFTHGRVEVRAKLASRLGTWPAIWMLGKNIIEPGGYWTASSGSVGWPDCGEIDIMEHWGDNRNYIQSAMHTPSSSGATVNHGGRKATNVANVFHNYAMEWSPDEIKFWVDGHLYYTYNPIIKDMDTWPFIADQYMLLNVAIYDPVDPNFTESSMVIDHVRIYQVATTPISDGDELEGIQFYPNPVSDNLTIIVPSKLVGAQAIMYTSTGQTIASITIENPTTTIDLSQYSTGIYLLEMRSESGHNTYKIRKE